MSAATAAVGSSSHGLTVEIAVQDPATQLERVFRSPLGPLRAHMRFFEPAIARQINEVTIAAVASASGATPPITLRAKCDHRTFAWLLEWTAGRAPPLTLQNIVSVSLSSNFLQMRALLDDALVYMSSHLTELVTSRNNLVALPVDLILRLSGMVRDSDLAATLQHLHERNHTAHPNRAFVAMLLQHHVCHRLGLEGDNDDDEEESTAGGAVKTRGVDARPSDALAASRSGVALKPSCGVRWCRLCYRLFDQAEMQRLIRAFQLSPPECPAQAAAANSDAGRSTAPQGSESNGGTTAANAPGIPAVRCVGPRGEVFTTHAESRRAMPVLLPAPPALKLGAGDSTTPASVLELERWAWRIIGATRYVSCRRCFHLVALTDVPGHHCSNLPHKFASPDNVADDVHSLVRWFFYCAEHHVYEDTGAGGGVAPLLFDGSRKTMTEEVVEVRLAPSVAGNTSSPTTGAAPGSAGARSAGWAGESPGEDAARLATPGAASAVPPLSFWAAKPFYVAEVMDKNIVDIDIQNYVERQHRFEVEAQQRRAAALFNPPHMRLSSAPAVAPPRSTSPSSGLAGSAGGSAGGAAAGKTGQAGKQGRLRSSARSPYGI